MSFIRNLSSSLQSKKKTAKQVQPVLFVHIPKAAGSAVNEFFVQRLGRKYCLLHAENDLRGRKPDPEKLNHFRFISGHLVYPNLRQHVDAGDRFRMAVLRKPIEQLVSHIAWMRYQAEPERSHAFRALPPHVKQICEGLTSFSLGNADRLEQFLATLEPGQLEFFDNCQTRYLLPNIKGPLSPSMLRRARSNLSSLDFVGITECLSDVFDYLAYSLGLEPSIEDLRVNESRRKYGLDATDPAIQEVLRPYLRFDDQAYEHAARMFGSCIYRMWTDLDGKGKHIINRERLRVRIKEHAFYHDDILDDA